MTNKENFEQAFEAELQKRLGFSVSGGLVGDELAKAEPLLDIAERLNHATEATLSPAAKARIENKLQQYVATVPTQPARIHGLQKWQLLVATTLLILGLSVGLLMALSPSDNNVTQITQLTQSANAISSMATASTLTPTVANNTSPRQTITPVDDIDFPLGILTPTRNIEMTSDDGILTCGQGLGYWKNHPSAWTGTTLTLGDQTYDQTELLAILDTSPQNDASILLARAMITAYLNGSSDTELLEFDTLLVGYPGKLPFAVSVASAAGQLMVNAAENLEPITADCLTSTPVDLNNVAPDEINNGNDSDTCKNPPPEHANAQGWRERCEEESANNNNGNNGNGNGNNGNGSNNGNGNGNNKN